MASFDWDIFRRRTSAFVLWAASDIKTPKLLLGQLKQDQASKFSFSEILEKEFKLVEGKPHLWELNLNDPKSGLSDLPDGVYHYWYRVQNKGYNSTGQEDILVTDPFATAVDYRPVESRNQPAAVIKLQNGKLIPCDPDGQTSTILRPLLPTALPTDNQLVIYELPVSWSRADSEGQDGEDIGTFRDVLSLLKPRTQNDSADNADSVSTQGIIADLGVNALEFLPTVDTNPNPGGTNEWGYAPKNYFAPDWDLSKPQHSASADLTELSEFCLRSGTRLISDVVMAFGHDPYNFIQYNTFHISAVDEPNNPDAHVSRPSGQLRNPYGGGSWRYIPEVETYDPESGNVKKLNPAQTFHRAHLAWWMSHYLLGGFRLDSIENIANWDFIQKFRADAFAHFNTIYGNDESTRDRFLIIGEELEMPINLLKGPNRHVDALWNDSFRERVRAAIVGESWGESSANPSQNFEWTVRKMIDCTQIAFADGHLSSGLQAVNYITSHDTAGPRRERLWNFLDHFPSIADHGAPGSKAQRTKLAFACLLTAAGIPMIFAGEEFSDFGDRSFADDTQKQRDPVNWARKARDPWRVDLFECVARLVRLRKTAPGLGDLEPGSTQFIHTDFTHQRRIMAWVRGRERGEKIVVLANFSDEATPGEEYRVNGWERLEEERDKENMEWWDVIAGAPAPDAGKEPLGPWDVKVYTLVPKGAQAQLQASSLGLSKL